MNEMSAAVINLAEKHNFDEWRIINSELQVKGVCPLCGGGQSRDRGTFSININTGAWNCKRGNCNGIDGRGKREGTFKQLCSFFGEKGFVGYTLPTVTEHQKKAYAKPSPDLIYPMTEEIVTYFASKRMISEQTLLDWKIGADKKGNIVFPFYRNGELIYVKYRKPKPYEKGDGNKEWQESNTEPILYGMDMTDVNRPLVICEGEIDALSLYEAGVSNVVSVPCGCSNLEWINLCWEFLEKFNQIILFGDSDEPGLEMVSTLSKRLGEDRCMIPKEYPEFIINGKDYNRICKDANEILICYGPDYLKSIVDSCEPAPIKGVLELSKIPFIDPTTVPRLLTKIPALDNMIGGFSEGSLCIISGKRGEGKSTLTGPLCLNAIEQGETVCVYSGELSSYKFLEWIMLQATERQYIEYKTDPRSGKNICCVSAEIQKRIKSWLESRFFLYDNSVITDEKQTDSILKVFEACARRYGTKTFVCDNIMSALVSADEENKAQAKFTAQLKAFANKYKAHVICIAHPRKTPANSTFSNDDVSGSSAINFSGFSEQSLLKNVVN